jgi:hypothetical protein
MPTGAGRSGTHAQDVYWDSKHDRKAICQSMKGTGPKKSQGTSTITMDNILPLREYWGFQRVLHVAQFE